MTRLANQSIFYQLPQNAIFDATSAQEGSKLLQATVRPTCELVINTTVIE